MKMRLLPARQCPKKAKQRTSKRSGVGTHCRSAATAIAPATAAGATGGATTDAMATPAMADIWPSFAAEYNTWTFRARSRLIQLPDFKNATR